MAEPKYPLTADLAGVLAVAVQESPRAGGLAAPLGAEWALVRMARALLHRTSAWRVAASAERTSLDSATLIR